MSSKTIYTILEEAANRYGDAPALKQPVPGKNGEEYTTWSWNQYRQIVREIACGLRSLGDRKSVV